MNIQLTAEQVRVIGSLMEKAITTPEQYPLTLNALRNACNQKSSRDPVMQMEQGLVQRTARLLEQEGLLSIREGAKVEKYVQRLCNTTLAKWKFDAAEYAVITLLFLRGAQTPGELRSRSGRLHEFEDNAAVAEVLRGLMEREEGAVVARLPKKAGRQDHEYMHLFSGEFESAPEEAAQERPSAGPSRVERLENRVASLETALLKLAEKLGEELDLVLEPGDSPERDDNPERDDSPDPTDSFFQETDPEHSG